MPSWVRKTCAVGIWLLVWQLAAMLVASDILLASPILTVATLGRNLLVLAFWLAIAGSMLRVFLGFAIAFVLGLALGALAYRQHLVAELLNPALTFIKSVPIVCFIVMLLIWFGSAWVSLAAVFLVAFPAIYFAVFEGLNQRDLKLDEMITVFQVKGIRKLLAYYWPSVLPFLQATCKTIVGMSWKSGVAAELIGLPLGSIGERIYRAKVLLNSADVFAWTIVVVAISVVAELLFLQLLERSENWLWRLSLPTPPTNAATTVAVASTPTAATAAASSTTATASPATTPATATATQTRLSPQKIEARNLSRSYDGNTVLNSLDLQLEPGGRYALNAPSGTGKTTLLRLLAGLDQPDSGTLTNANSVSMVFQEARLFERQSAVENLRLTVGQAASGEAIRATLERLLPADSLDQPTAALSGGMRRRVELCRALLAPSQCVLLDEPFAGLDAKNHTAAQELTSALLGKRTIVIVSHDPKDVELLNLKPISLTAK